MSQEPPEQVVAADEFPSELPLLLLPEQVVFPMALAPMRVQGASETKLLNDVAMGNRLLALLTLRDGESGSEGLENAYEIGCIARVMPSTIR